jgi:hypothetical protein
MNPEQIIKLAANGNTQAEDFARAWYLFVRMLDNSYDKDVIVTDDEMGKLSVQFIMELCGNEWFLQHKPVLFGLMVCSFNAWIDANRRQGVERSVLSGMYHEVIYMTAFLTGGWAHLRHVTSECREYKQPGKESHGALR